MIPGAVSVAESLPSAKRGSALQCPATCRLLPKVTTLNVSGAVTATFGAIRMGADELEPVGGGGGGGGKGGDELELLVDELELIDLPVRNPNSRISMLVPVNDSVTTRFTPNTLSMDGKANVCPSSVRTLVENSCELENG